MSAQHRQGVTNVSRRNGSATAIIALCLVLTAAFPAPAAAAAAPPKTTMHLPLNQSLLLDSEQRIRRVSIGRPEIADVTVVTPRQLMVTGKSAGRTTLIYWDDEGRPSPVNVEVWDADDKSRSALHRIAPDEKFEIEGTGDTIVLTGRVSTDTARNRIAEGARAYAKNVVNLLDTERVDQVSIQVRVAEVDRTTARELGFGFQSESTLRGSVSPGSAFTPFFGNLRDSDPARVGPNASFSDAVNLFIAKPGLFPKFAGFIRALHDKGAMKTLAEPTLVVANGSEGKFLAGGEFPVVYNAPSGGGSTPTVLYKEFGVRLHFQPRIAGNGEIFLHVAQEVSDLDFNNAVVLSGFRIPALKSRKTETSLQLADGQTFVLAGLIDNKVSKEMARIPLLGDIPVLGALFRSTRFRNSETELMVMVTPKIVRPQEKGSLPQLPTDRMRPEELDPGLLR